MDLKSCNEYDPLKVFDHTYAPFLETNLNERKDLNFTDLDVIQKTVLKDRDSFPDCNKTYQLTVEKTLDRILSKYEKRKKESKKMVKD